MVAPGFQEIVSKCKHGREATERRIVAEGGGEGGRETALNVSFMSFNSDSMFHVVIIIIPVYSTYRAIMKLSVSVILETLLVSYYYTYICSGRSSSECTLLNSGLNKTQ